MPFGWAAAGAAVAGVAGSVIQGEATKGAAKTAANAQRDAQQQMRNDLMPYMDAGKNALAPQQALLGLQGQEAADAAMGNFQQSPGYQYQLEQGLRAVDAGAAAKGMLRSGATLKAEQTLGNNLAAQDFGTYYNRLAGLTGLGQNAAAGVGNAGNQAAAGQAQTAMSAGSTQASIYGNAAQGVGNALNQYGNNQRYEQQNALYQGSQPGMSYGSFNVGNSGGGGGQQYFQNAPVAGF